MLNRGDVVRQIGVGRHEHRDQGQRKHQDRKPRRQQCGTRRRQTRATTSKPASAASTQTAARGHRPRTEFRSKPCPPANAAAQIRPDKGKQRDGGGHCRRTDAKTHRRVAVDQRPVTGAANKARNTSRAAPTATAINPAKEYPVVQHRM